MVSLRSAVERAISNSSSSVDPSAISSNKKVVTPLFSPIVPLALKETSTPLALGSSITNSVSEISRKREELKPYFS